MTSPTNVTGPSGGTGFVLGEDEGDGYFWLGSLTINKVGSSQTLSGLSIVDHRVPAGYAPPAHQHHDDETFYILEGQFAVRCGQQSWLAGPGSLVFLPRDIPHGFVVSGAGPGRTLLITAPGGFDEVISELGTATDSRSLPGPDVPMPDPDRIQSVSEAHGITGAPGF
jgi:quercetin dioxygenase-like cupin family protein